MRRLIAVAILALAFLAGYYSGRTPLQSVQAQSPLPPRVWTAPKSWGQFKGVYHDQLLFEDEHGTIRSVFPNSTAVVFTIRRN
jgi:hypothetical protein